MNPNLTVKILSMIATFEGSANGNINVWDEQLLSMGTMHFAVLAGPGGAFLRRIQQLDPAGYRRVLGQPFSDATKAGQAALVTFVRGNVYRQPARWRAPFQALSRLPAWAAADAEACAPFLQAGVGLAIHYRLITERGLAWAVDRCVQQGPAVRPVVEAVFGKLASGTAEYNVMKELALAYAGSANPKYAAVVLARSLTVALGSSADSKYPGDVNLLLDYGIDYNARWK
jgi:hypothetical protein